MVCSLHMVVWLRQGPATFATGQPAPRAARAALAVVVCRVVQHPDKATANDAACKSVLSGSQGTARECGINPRTGTRRVDPIVGFFGAGPLLDTHGSARAQPKFHQSLWDQEASYGGLWGRHAERPAGHSANTQ